jgi:alkanesulfonate monooxygenase SsuD/methylene tetrahydromethanopterin reductase-like flavin-dependent oxidoreductase (luciferase family)
MDYGAVVELIVAMAAAAMVTSRIKLGTSVLGDDYRHPLQLHRMVATPDSLPGGRFELGIGAGWQRADYQAVGLWLDPAGVRIDRLGESISAS